ncbi:MAG: hypothetical protein U1E98_03470 [Moraxella osloensis]
MASGIIKKKGLDLPSGLAVKMRLDQIIEQQGGHDNGKPSDTNRFFAKMLYRRKTAACHTQLLVQDDKTDVGLSHHKLISIDGIDGLQDFDIVLNMINPNASKINKNHSITESKQLANTFGTKFFAQKQYEQNE